MRGRGQEIIGSILLLAKRNMLCPSPIGFNSEYSRVTTTT
jgi:hypothetical protein